MNTYRQRINLARRASRFPAAHHRLLFSTSISLTASFIPSVRQEISIYPKHQIRTDARLTVRARSTFVAPISRRNHAGARRGRPQPASLPREGDSGDICCMSYLRKATDQVDSCTGLCCALQLRCGGCWIRPVWQRPHGGCRRRWKGNDIRVPLATMMRELIVYSTALTLHTVRKDNVLRSR